MSDHPAPHSALADALAKKGYETLTPVQSAVLDPTLADQDLLVSAQTGSGKTVAFGLAMASTLLGEAAAFRRAETPLALCIAPTRELALQVKRELDWLYDEAGAKTASCVGGMDIQGERKSLARGAHIVVGTPGRLCDHIKRGSLNLTGLQAVVLDEADEMLNMGFREELETILGASPAERRTLMFSATVPKSIIGLTKKYQRNAVRVNTAAEAKQHLDITYRALSVAHNDRETAILNILRFYDAETAIVFGDTRVAVNRLTQKLSNRGFRVVALSGEMSQKERSGAMQSLRNGQANVCVATDVAARGLDLPSLELVIHADVPRGREALLHRSGRTGRAGRKGVSAIIVTPNRRRNAERVLRDAGITAEWANAPSAEEIRRKDDERLFEDMALDGEATDIEIALVKRLLKAHDAEHIALKFVRQYRDGLSAPEELGTADSKAPPTRQPRVKTEFDDSVWFSLNLGRKQKAEPKWILPMLMKSGGLKKGAIGTIKITETKTFIELDRDAVDGFIDTIGPDGKIEKAITAEQVDGKPDFNDKAPQGRPKRRSQDKPWEKREKKTSDYKPKSDRKPKWDGDQKSEKSKSEYKPKSDYKPKSKPDNQSDGKKPRPDSSASFKRKPRTDAKNNFAAPTSFKKPHKKKTARAAAQMDGGKKAKVKKGERKSTRKKDRS